MSVTEANAIDARYAAAKAEIERHQAIETGQGGALFFAAMAYGDALDESAFLKKASHVAKLICIAALFLFPNLLVWHVLL